VADNDSQPALEDHDGGRPVKKEMSPHEAMELLKAGQPVVNARIKRFRFKGEIPFRVEFRNCTLIQLDFDSATFAEDVKFIGCNLDKLNCTKRNTFEKLLDFSHSTLNKANIARITVKGFFNAGFTHFKGKFAFLECTFMQKASFWESQFQTWSDFRSCKFHGDADFRSVHCHQGFVLTKCTFHADFLFRGSNVEKKFQADGSRFEKMLDLSKAKLHDYCYLEGIEAGPEMRFAFVNALAKRILVTPEQLEGRLASEVNGDYPTAMQEYGLLKKCYQEQHRFDSEDWAFYRFKVNQRRAKPMSWKRPWTVWRTCADWLFLDLGCGYGTNPARAIRTAIFIILGFALLYSLRADMFYAEKLPFPPEPGEDALAAKMSVRNRIMIGFITSVSVFTSGMGGIREIAQGWMNVPVMIESIMGTLLFGLFIVAFSRKVIR